ncbi:hypothetical protein DW651_04780 [Subdoligranulum sp. AM23-21AC]|nr:hypothetical protein [Bittarella massiliensis (ex Durand et al. 2017)]RGD21917.1 hypothetical protein DW651_04780 [Subdoligranulum sp. AM23-21AC]RJW80606.1 hypothetical protein DXA32_14745 [Subdoligranulum sp. OF01-18]
MNSLILYLKIYRDSGLKLVETEDMLFGIILLSNFMY